MMNMDIHADLNLNEIFRNARKENELQFRTLNAKVLKTDLRKTKRNLREYKESIGI